jgi:hypothetical protein
MQMHERESLARRLAPHMVSAWNAAGRPDRSTVPSWLEAGAILWPHLWIRDYKDSLVLTVKGDARCEIEAAHCTLAHLSILCQHEIDSWEKKLQSYS